MPRSASRSRSRSPRRSRGEDERGGRRDGGEVRRSRWHSRSRSRSRSPRRSPPRRDAHRRDERRGDDRREDRRDDRRDERRGDARDDRKGREDDDRRHSSSNAASNESRDRQHTTSAQQDANTVRPAHSDNGGGRGGSGRGGGGGSRLDVRPGESRGEAIARRRERMGADEDDSKYEFGKPAANPTQDGSGDGDVVDEEAAPAPPKIKPNYETTGKLAEATNTVKGVVLKYNEPTEARVPKLRWRLYPFKDGKPLDALHVHRQSAYLLGRERVVADIPLDHPSCSKQHAVLQFRQVQVDKEDGSIVRKTKPYILDLESANGTYLNGDRIEAKRYYELLEKDVLKFGFSSREYVVLNERSVEDPEEDDEVA